MDEISILTIIIAYALGILSSPIFQAIARRVTRPFRRRRSRLWGKYYQE